MFCQTVETQCMRRDLSSEIPLSTMVPEKTIPNQKEYEFEYKKLECNVYSTPDLRILLL